MNKCKVGQKVIYKDYMKNRKVIGKIVSVNKIIDHIEEKLKGKELCCINHDETCYPTWVLAEELKLVRDVNE